MSRLAACRARFLPCSGPVRLGKKPQAGPAFSTCCDALTREQRLAVGCAVVPEPSAVLYLCQMFKAGLSWMFVQQSAAFWQACRDVLDIAYLCSARLSLCC